MEVSTLAIIIYMYVAMFVYRSGSMCVYIRTHMPVHGGECVYMQIHGGMHVNGVRVCIHVGTWRHGINVHVYNIYRYII